MGLLHLQQFTLHFPSVLPLRSSPIRPRSSKLFAVRFCLPFAPHEAKYYNELQAAVDVVTTACRICVNVQKSLFSEDGRIMEKTDNTPVTIADFGVQALISLVQVLDPIDGTRGFLKGRNALYVVGLALVVDGEVVLGVMGCPSWQENFVKMNKANGTEFQKKSSASGIIMVSHVGCGTWTICLSQMLGGETRMLSSWTRRSVDQVDLVHRARFCIPESQTWDSLPLSTALTAMTNTDNVGEDQILLLRACCGSLCKYLMVALGEASVFVQRVRTKRIIRAWDHVSGMICVQEAGGKVTDWRGRQLNFSADELERRAIFPEGGVIVSNGNLHAQILKLISSNSSVV